jgi:hypothetical protein
MTRSGSWPPIQLRRPDSRGDAPDAKPEAAAFFPRTGGAACGDEVGLDRHQPDWNNPADKFARTSKEIERTDCSSRPECALTTHAAPRIRSLPGSAAMRLRLPLNAGPYDDTSGNIDPGQRIDARPAGFNHMKFIRLSRRSADTKRCRLWSCPRALQRQARLVTGALSERQGALPFVQVDVLSLICVVGFSKFSDKTVVITQRVAWQN